MRETCGSGSERGSGSLPVTGSARPARRARPCRRNELVEIGRRWRVSQLRLVRLATELDDSGEWALDGSPTCAHWIASALDVEVCTARGWLRVGRALRGLPLTSTAVDEGRLSFTKVRSLTRLATPDNEAELVELAEQTAAGRLGMALAAWSAQFDDPHERNRRQHRERSLSWRTEPDGMVSVTGRLTPLQAGVFTSVVDATVMRRDGRDGTGWNTTVGENDATGSRGSHGARSAPRSWAWSSLAQQRADALIDVLDSGGVSVDAEVILHVRGDGCTLDDGTPIEGSIVERIAGGAFLRVLIHEADRMPINASGRHRHPTQRQRRVVKERDGCCVDCGGTDFLECDHQPDFDITERTLIDELRLRCARCHRLRHERQRR